MDDRLTESAGKMLIIGLAGGVASGKSFVANCFRELGAEHIDADEIGHRVLDQSNIQEQIVTRWGGGIIDQGKINRRQLAKIVFAADAPADELTKLEQITHPAIGEHVERQLQQFKQQGNVPAVVLDAPVMFRAGWDVFCDRIVFVDAPLSIRQKRAGERGWSEDELLRRESFQTPIEEKRRRATDMIDNSGTQSETKQQVQDLWNAWRLPGKFE
jgi:dephospho-CoA kinase